jgi:long-chain acyl-CoA synthetase
MTLFAAPTMLKRLLTVADRLHLPHLKTIVYGGGPMYLADAQQALALLGPRLVQIYGQGESPMTITALARHWHVDDGTPGHAARLASVGLAQTGVELRIARVEDETEVPASIDEALPAGEIGEILVRGDTVMQGYWNNPQATARTLRNGWLHTGDVGVLDAAGFLTLKDRSKDVIISGGSNIYPREVEEVLLMHAEVLEASVIGQPHAEWGEQVVACVVLRQDAGSQPQPQPQTQTQLQQRLQQELDALCLAHIARFKRPKRYLFLPALPKNMTGKVLKTALRAML